MFIDSKILFLFSVKCSNYTDIQTLTLISSFEKSQHSASLLRLLSCSNYVPKNDPFANIVETEIFNDLSMGEHENVHELGYNGYNLPYSFLTYLENAKKLPPYVAIVNNKMIFREPIDPIKLGVKPGNAVSIRNKNFKGIETILKPHFLPKKENPYYDTGDVVIMHSSDALNIAKLWFSYTLKIRNLVLNNNNYDSFFLEKKEISDLKIEQVKMSSELYGYILASSEYKLQYTMSEELLLFLKDTPYLQKKPYIISFETPFQLYEKEYNLNSYKDVDDYCENAQKLPEIKPNYTKKEAVSLEAIIRTNLAVCEYSQNCESICNKKETQNMNEILSYISNDWKCKDEHDSCEAWALQSECESNPLFMNNVCTKSCNKCEEETIKYDNLELIFLLTIFTLILITFSYMYKYKIKKIK